MKKIIDEGTGDWLQYESNETNKKQNYTAEIGTNQVAGSFKIIETEQAKAVSINDGAVTIVAKGEHDDLVFWAIWTVLGWLQKQGEQYEP